MTANDYKEYMCFVSFNELCGITVNEHITVTDDRVIPTLEGLFYGQIATLSVCISISENVIMLSLRGLLIHISVAPGWLITSITTPIPGAAVEIMTGD